MFVTLFVFMAKNVVARRGFLKASLAAALPVAVGIGSPPMTSAASRTGRALKILCIGAHPDDPESGCGGTLARYAQLGHTVTIIYLTRGERGIRGTGLEDAGKIRSAEAVKACKVMGSKSIFFGQIDGDTRINAAEVENMRKLVEAEGPDVVLMHWPIDSHMDHQVASVLATRSCMAMAKQPEIYFFEVNTGSQSRGFLPNVYVDISDVLDKKKAALFAHKSQGGERIWKEHHEVMAAWRGREIGVAAAEGFVRLNYGNAAATAGI